MLNLHFGGQFTPEFWPILYKTRDSYNTDYIAQQLAAAAIQSRDYAKNTWQKVRKDRELLASALAKLGFTVTPSQANFLLAKLPEGHSAENLYLQLKSENILVRFFDQERLRDKLSLQRLQINRLLEITQAINDNISINDLFELYNKTMSFEMQKVLA